MNLNILALYILIPVALIFFNFFNKLSAADGYQYDPNGRRRATIIMLLSGIIVLTIFVFCIFINL